MWNGMNAEAERALPSLNVTDALRRTRRTIVHARLASHADLLVAWKHEVVHPHRARAVGQ
jgi:hypothetical protein